jgi:hypothetical protein
VKRPLLLCCSSDVLVIFHEGHLWFRRHEWNSDQWAPLELPGATKRPASKTPETVASTRRNKGYTRHSTR